MYTGTIIYKGFGWKIWAEHSQALAGAAVKIVYLVDVVGGKPHRELRVFTGYKVQYVGKKGGR